MCGLCCILTRRGSKLCFTDVVDSILLENLQRRGPDSHSTLTSTMPGAANICSSRKEQVVLSHSDGDVENMTKSLKFSYDCLLSGHVLNMRGSMCSQPACDDIGNMLLWNGEVFDGIAVAEEENDTQKMLEALGSCHSDKASLLNLLSTVRGPWALIYMQRSAGALWFGRDYFGRRSLLWHFASGDPPEYVAICSVGIRPSKVPLIDWHEIPANGIYRIDLQQQAESTLLIEHFPWRRDINDLPETSISCERYFPKSVHIHVCNSLPSLTSPVPPLSFDAGPVRDLTADLAGISQRTIGQTVDLSALYSEERLVAVHRFIEVLSEAVHRRVCSIRSLTPSLSIADVNVSQSGVAVLFSGGLDSIVLAVLAHRHVPPGESIDLLNVAFEQKRLAQCDTVKKGHNTKKIRKNKERLMQEQMSLKDLREECFANLTQNVIAGDIEGLEDDQKGTDSSFEVPDRLTARSGLQALQALCPGRQWILVEINISRTELADERRRRITHLVYPADTVLDDSIGCALWFAARGQGTCWRDKVQGGGCSYTSTARVLFSGVGADEQLAGYSRHRQRFATSSWPGLASELQMELDRISQRNLGRDDRIVSDHGKEARFPYLDEDVVAFLSSLPLWLKADLRLPRGIGDKLLLRLAAHWLGLTDASTLPKRAMQFGSRIARLEGSRERGSDCCHRLQEL
uniref:Asparagine synthetase domain-containing protein 1 n=1 Tax=Eptatretus burgeri TaxID=7764 RepID=A0A8C4QVK8_EPTBU